MAKLISSHGRVMSRLRHIRIEAGALRLDYKASAEQARDVACALTQLSPDVIVTVDDDVCRDLPPLPCAGLWS